MNDTAPDEIPLDAEGAALNITKQVRRAWAQLMAQSCEDRPTVIIVFDGQWMIVRFEKTTLSRVMLQEGTDPLDVLETYLGAMPSWLVEQVEALGGPKTPLEYWLLLCQPGTATPVQLDSVVAVSN